MIVICDLSTFAGRLEQTIAGRAGAAMSAALEYPLDEQVFFHAGDPLLFQSVAADVVDTLHTAIERTQPNDQ